MKLPEYPTPPPNKDAVKRRDHRLVRLGFSWLIGLKVQADHPTTCLNPSPTFIIHDAKLDHGKLYVRGKETMWFHGGMISLPNR